VLTLTIKYIESILEDVKKNLQSTVNYRINKK
jgi:hypothetical protein